VAEYLQNEASIPVQLDPSGNVGEFTVFLDGKPVIRKRWIKSPSAEEILARIRQGT